GVFALVMFGALKAFGHLRANTKADTIGIDLYEHGTAVWPDLLPVPADEAPAAASASPAIAPAVGD
ncbi:MAG: ammonium transporter, partial [Anaerolineae bacterium]|nr:ammonium transporter [Anaerolineae bacterium]MEB2366583.1 ammonium transporter [Chloroflexota bacterium]